MIKFFLIYLCQSFKDGFYDCINNYENWEILIFDNEFKQLMGISDRNCNDYFWYWLNDGSISFKQWLNTKRGLKNG